VNLRVFSFICTCILLCCSSYAFSEVKIEVGSRTVKFDENPKLSQVLSRFVISTDYYWHNAAIYDLQSSTARQLKREVIKELDALIAITGRKTQKHAALMTVKRQVSSWNVADKLPLVVDYDLIRVKEELNPRLDSGHYYLYLPFRTYDVNIVGAVKQPTTLTHIGTASIKTYLDDKRLELLEYADSEYVFLIHPNGSYKKVSLGLNNRQHVEVPPGGMIYIPLNELPFNSTNTELNEKIARLAGNRLP